ncbi:unnamed protein product [Dicrocoelium dendriticum]|nr:unnamed protein product [Dicrocoelium dendriticum]
MSSPTLNLYRVYESKTRSTEPILLLISPGADPSQELVEAAAMRFASKTNTVSRYRQVTMGQGQADLALDELHAAAEVGDWLCLKNLHLVIGWLPTLEKEINQLLLTSGDNRINSSSEIPGTGRTRVHQDFRLWLTAEPHPGFPSTLLKSCLKVAYEAPPGLKRNLRRTYESWTRSYFSKGNSVTRATALATLAWFHAIVQERRTYTPQGWTKFYEFTYTDLRAAADVIDRLFLATGNKGPVKDAWTWIQGLLGDSIYGGRLDNSVDSTVLKSYLKQMFGEDMQRSLRLGPLKLPGTTELRDYLMMIEGLPEYDQPTHFNLPANVSHSVQRNAMNRMIGQLRMLSRTVGTGHKFDKAAWSHELGPILVLWKKLNQGLQLIQTRSAGSKSGGIESTRQHLCLTMENAGTTEKNPVLDFLRLESSNALRLVNIVHSGLAGLSRACRGTQFITASLYDLATKLLHSETPSIWLAGWQEGPEEPIHFLRQLVSKANAVQNWLKLAESHQLLQHNSGPLDLADLFRPTTFLNAIRQQTARGIGVPIDQLELVSIWPEQQSGVQWQREEPYSIRVAKLKLEGASFDSGRLAPCLSESPSFTHLPEVLLVWKKKKDLELTHMEGSISLPLYMDPERQYLITNLRVPCPVGSQNQWIQAGAALLVTCA